uniref:F-box domain protein n=1 Tax=Marseillevirus LCMAC102 TaxID=2506603 RepID=A0A481YVK6_9VIRU|nr:MAG: F-box domain protein [Marseillevirus LCMAC102]
MPVTKNLCVYNEKTKRCAKKKEDKSEKVSKKKEDKIFNKKSKRWVLKTGVVGKRLLAEQKKVQKEPATKKKVQKEPATKKKVQKEPATKKKVQKEPATKKKVQKEPAKKKKVQKESAKKKKVQKSPSDVRDVSRLENLPDDMVKLILLRLNRKDLKSVCQTSDRMRKICKNPAFIKQYSKLHLRPTIIIYRDYQDLSGEQTHAFFWSREEADKHKDKRNREIKKIYEISRGKVFLDDNSTEKILYYYYKKHGHPKGVFPSLDSLKRYDVGLGKICYNRLENFSV